MKRLNIIKTNLGFTLVEVLVATFIFAVVVAGAAGFLVYHLKNYSFSFEEYQSINHAQFAMTMMLRELREARSGDNGAWTLEQTDDNTIVFFSDVTGDSRTDRVRYFLDGTDLKKGVIEPTQVPVSYPTINEQITTIASFVNLAGNPLITYYNGSWPSDTVNNPLSNANRILNTRYVSVYLRIDVNPDYAAQPYELTSGVTIRSLKDNL